MKKNKLLYFLFSLIPGAAHMYLGLTKRGVVLMGFFVAVFCCGSAMTVLLVILPVIWFYCFFDSWNKFALSKEELAKIDDSFLFFVDAFRRELPAGAEFLRIPSDKALRISGIAVIFFGIFLLIESGLNVADTYSIYNSTVYLVIEAIRGLLPRVIISALLIFLGVKLLKHKKKELTAEDSDAENELYDVYSGRDDAQGK